MAHLSRFPHRLLFMLSVALAAVVSLHAQRPSFRSTIDLVMLNVTVTGFGGRYVADLSGDDFQVFEDSRPQELAYFSPANVPLSVSLVLDTSSSMDEQMPLSKQAAMDFIARLRPGDVAEVVSFDSRVEVLQPMTSDRALLEAAIQRMRASGSTALYNAVYIVLRQLEKVRPQTGDDVRRQVNSHRKQADAIPAQAADGSGRRLHPDRQRADESIRGRVFVQQCGRGRRVASRGRTSEQTEPPGAHSCGLLRSYALD